MSVFNHHNINCFYDDLEKVMEKGFAPDRIWNADETVQKPFGDAGVRSFSSGKRKKKSSEIYSSSRVTRHLEEEFSAKQKRGKKKRQVNQEDSDTDDDESTITSMHADSDRELADEFKKKMSN
ncbi:hypothetical protein ElyMa_002380000 [Elysia marginata]|uniref:Uncharacterized protein n=1 Tax=Elysia marginata TaxID=1093978 RepID=A0AAV4GDA8_9GAST|nr:hypothetical protein ElyMa_002380000 [Elysia marginata]